MSVISTKPKWSNLSYENIVPPFSDDDTVTREAILPDDKGLNGYRSDIEVELGMTPAAREAMNENSRARTANHDSFVQALTGQSRLGKEQYNSNWPARYLENEDPKESGRLD